MPDQPSSFRTPLLVALVLILAVGTWLRIPGEKHREWKGTDEGYYERYVTQLDETGLIGWPKLVAAYIERQTAEKYAFLPPTRLLFLGGAHLWRQISGTSPIEAVRAMAFASGVAMLLIGAVFAFRLSGLGASVGVSALAASSPLLIHLSHRALIDGFFAFWALVAVWGLWECLREPERRGWLVLYGSALAAMVLTKENAAFVFPALCGIIILNRWVRIGRVTPALLVVTVVAPLIASVLLVVAAGGVGPLVTAFRLNVEKSVILPYAIATGDGPWHRYFLDFLLVSPAVTILSVVALGGTSWASPAKRHLVIFLVISYALMAQVRYGMNMRYGAMWEVPMCWLAFELVRTLWANVRHSWRPTAVALTLTLVCTLELQSYYRLFVAGGIYDPVAGALIQPLRIFKPVPQP
jgi:4-amino-4-deoxy-L-arabinose transferase-like glycosyltransferase